MLVVEDEPQLVRLIRAVLESAGHHVQVASTGQAALETIALSPPDLLLLDLRLPGDLDGYATCRRVREFSMVPIIMLTARASEDDKLQGFAAGADDYITKPFSARELLARVHAVLRRTGTHGDSPAVVSVRGLEINLARQQVQLDGVDVHLTPTEYRLLLTLARQPDRVVPHADLLTAVWGAEYRDETEYLRTYMRYLRRKLEVDPAHPRFLRTRAGVGYFLATDA